MVRPGNVIADRFGRVASQKHRSGMADAREHRFRIVDREFEMFGGKRVDERRRLVEIARDDDRAVGFPALPRDIGG